MKKGVIVVLVLVILLVLGYFFVGKEKAEAPQNGQETESVTEKMMPSTGGESSVISSIKDAMGLGKKMKCTYATKEDGKTVSSSVIVDGKKFKFSSEMNGEKMQGVFDGDTQYTWTEGKTRQGWKMKMSCIEEATAAMKDITSGAGTQNTVKDYQEAFDAAADVKCEPATNEDFSIPTDIVFADQCEMMKQSTEMLKNLKNQLPSNIEIPNIPGMPTGN